MNLVGSMSGLVQGLVAGVVAIVVFAIRAAIEGRPGVTFADLWTSLAVGVAVGIVPLVMARFLEWRIRRTYGPTNASSGGFVHASGGMVHGSGGMDRFDKFTDRARQVLTFAQDEAQRLNHTYIGTEHLLLGLVRAGDGTAAKVLGRMGVDLAKVRMVVEFTMGRGDSPVVGEVGLTPRAKRVIELAIDEARRLDHHYIGTEHLLLGLVREGEGTAAQVFESLGVSLGQTRAEVIHAIGSDDDPP
jgi:hypothetical protein